MFTVFAVVSLALGLGVTTAIYSTVGSLLWHPSPVDDAEHLAVITRESSGPRTFWLNVLSAPDVEDLRRQWRSVPALAATSYVQSTLSDSAHTSPFAVEAVTGNYFSTTGFGVHLGRGIQPADDDAMAGAVVVLSYEFWRSKAGANPGIVGQTVRIAGQPFVVIGVAEERVQRVRDTYGWFGFVGGDGWIPLVDRPLVTGVRTTSRDENTLGVVARLPADVSVASVAAEVRGIGAALDRTAPIVWDGASKPDASHVVRDHRGRARS